MLEYYYSCLIFDPRGNAPQLDLEKCLDSADNPSPVINHPLGQTDIVSESSIVHFLVERIYQSEAFYIQLQDILHLSKTKTAVSQAAVNAITILVRAEVRFNGDDLRGVQIPGADLSEGKFDSAQLQGADLTGVRFKSAWLRQADFSGATMNDVRFGEKSYFGVPNLWSAAISSDGKLLAAGLTTGDIKEYDTFEFRLRQTLQGHSLLVRSVDISSDNSMIASGSDDGTVRIWNLKGRKDSVFQGHKHPVYCVAFAPDSRRIASAGDDGTTRIWDIESGSCVHTLNTAYAIEIAVVNELTVSWSPCGRQIATGATLSRELLLWDAETGELERTLEAEGQDMIVYSRQGKLLALGRCAELLDLASDIEGNKSVIIRSMAQFTKAVFSEDEQTIVLACVDGSIQLWDGVSGSYITGFNGHSNVIVAVALLDDLELVSVSRDGTIRFWQLDNELGQKENYFGPPSPYTRGHGLDARSLVYSPSGDYLLSAGDERWVLLWDTGSGVCRGFLELDRGPKNMAISPNGRQLAVAGRIYQLSHNEGVKEDNRFGSDTEGAKKYAASTNRARLAEFSPCGRWMASGNDKGIVRLRNMQSNEDARLLEGHQGGIVQMRFSPNGCQLVSLCRSGAIVLWDTECAEQTEVLGVTGSTASYSPCGNMLAISDGISIHLWKMQEKVDTVLLTELKGLVNCIAWSPCGDWIAVGDKDRAVRLWRISIKGSEPVGSNEIIIRDIPSPVMCLVWNPTDPLEFAVGCHNGSIFIWKITEVRGEFRVELVWDSSTSLLIVSGARIDQVEGLERMQRDNVDTTRRN